MNTAFRASPGRRASQNAQAGEGAPSALPSVGDVVADKYRIERVAGEGAMGMVYVAHHLVLDQRVALKFLFVDSSESRDETVERFVREAQAAARLRSEHVVRVTDAGSVDGGLPFLVMEYLEGCDLAELLRLEGPLAPADMADYALQVLSALAEAHAAGIVHRDLKPANLFLADRGDHSTLVKILDFGISKQKSERAQWRELTGKTVLGTPAYISPEQLRSSRNVDARADIWSLGVSMYELLTGTLPFDGETPGELFAAILEKTPVPARSRRPELPPAWDELLSRCLRRDPEERFEDVGELAEALAPLGSGRWANLLPGIEEALTRSVRSIPRPAAALVQAAVEAAVLSYPPPPVAPVITHAAPGSDRQSAAAAIATDRTLLALVVPKPPAAARRATKRWPVWAGGIALVVTAAACAVLAVSVRTAHPAAVAAVNAARAVESPAAPPAEVVVPADPAPQAEPAPEVAVAPSEPAASPAPNAPPATTSSTKRRTPPAPAKKAGAETRPNFLRAWR